MAPPRMIRGEEGFALFMVLLITLVVSVLASVVISWLFESVFLVRLP